MRAERTTRLRREAWGFAIGSVLFLVGAVPFYAQAVGPGIDNLTFVLGAIFFTAAAFIQLALSGRKPPRKESTSADRYDWWAALIQFAGTLLFNLSTTLALITALEPATRVGSGWKPDAYGSACFLISSSLAMAATVRRDKLWDPRARTWQCSWFNLVGSVFFAISAIGAYVLPTTGDLLSQIWANLGTGLGAICFLIAALLSRREIGAPAPVT